MGRILIDSSADYSASPVGHVGLYTSVTSGLLALHELRYSKSKACHNNAPGKWGGTVAGSPTFNSTSINTDLNNFVDFGYPPTSGGLTIAFILKIKNGGTSGDGVVGEREGNIATQGTFYTIHFNRRVQVQANHYPAGTTYPFSSGLTATPFLDYVAGDDGTYHLFYVTLEDNVAATLYDAKTGLSNATATVGRAFLFDTAGVMRTCPFNGTSAQDIALFAHWNRVINSTERGTFYSEMKEQVARYGLTI